ncbi:phospholipid scramblase 2 [Aplysia californica]|uniref:Phospholipid scramblase n=1 Tax=Aplysia californica TaxID=6500 RepID=A0ABM0K9B5_APLCA|nr:phospholipid scramblase 2 [Aplysia californica]
MSEKPPLPEVHPGPQGMYPPGPAGSAPYPTQPGQGGQPAAPGAGWAVPGPTPQAGPQPGADAAAMGMYPSVGPGGQAIAMQPVPGAPPPAGSAGWGPGPGAPPVAVSAPPGLEYLTRVDQLLVKQKMEALEAFTGFETNNKYEVLNTMGQRVYMAVEDTCCCTRCCCGASRPFDMKILDNHKKEVMHLSRPLRCSTCWCPCCLQKMTVEAPKGSVIGFVRQAWSCCHPKYKVNNAEDDTVLRIKGPCCRCNICGDIEFEVTSPDESTHVGQITKQWSGLAKEIFTDADNFGVTFPIDLDVKTKATTLGAVFLIDFMYFEQDKGDVKKEAKQLTS